MSDFRQKLRAALERAIVSANAESDEEIEVVLKTFRSRADRQIVVMREKDPELARSATRILDETLMEFHMTPSNESPTGSKAPDMSDAALGTDTSVYSGSRAAVNEEQQMVNPDIQPSQTMPAGNDQRKRSVLAPFLAGVFVTLCAAALAVFVANRTGYLPDHVFFTSDEERPVLIPSEDTILANEALPELTDAMLTAKAILDNDPASVTVESSDRFYAFRDVFPGLYGSMSSRSLRDARIVVRRDGADYKILLVGRLCPLATNFGVFEKDTAREPGYQVLCEYFGFWSEGGKDF